MMKRCKVETSTLGDGWGFNLGVGMVVDVDAPLGGSPGPVSDYVREGTFEELEDAPAEAGNVAEAPRARRKTRGEGEN